MTNKKYHIWTYPNCSRKIHRLVWIH